MPRSDRSPHITINSSAPDGHSGPARDDGLLATFARPWFARRWALLAVAGFILWIAAAEGISAAQQWGWTRVTDLAGLNRAGIMFVPKLDAFVLAGRSRPYALSAANPHGRRAVAFCPSDGYFEDIETGDQFDRFGRSVAGPDRLGLGRVPLEVSGGDVLIKPGVVVPVPAGGSEPLAAAGLSCVLATENPGLAGPGFLRPPPLPAPTDERCEGLCRGGWRSGAIVHTWGSFGISPRLW
jgi:hypothetical protein